MITRTSKTKLATKDSMVSMDRRARQETNSMDTRVETSQAADASTLMTIMTSSKVTIMKAMINRKLAIRAETRTMTTDQEPPSAQAATYTSPRIFALDKNGKRISQQYFS
jgi:hypothetical protein